MRRVGYNTAAAIAVAGVAAKLYCATAMVATPFYPPHAFPLLTTAAFAAALGSALAITPPRRRLAAALAVDVAATAVVVADLRASSVRGQ